MLLSDRWLAVESWVADDENEGVLSGIFDPQAGVTAPGTRPPCGLCCSSSWCLVVVVLQHNFHTACSGPGRGSGQGQQQGEALVPGMRL